MEPHHQTAIFKAMASPDFYPHPCFSSEQCETHISMVFLTGEWVYKIKKSVNYGFLDYTTLEKRKHYCRQEVLLNQRLAKDVYIDAIPITFSAGRYHLGGGGDVVEYAVKMRQLPDAWAMDHRLETGTLRAGQIEKLADKLANFYLRAETNPLIEAIGGWETIRQNCEENFDQIEPFAGYVVDPAVFQDIRTATRTFLAHKQALFQERAATGKIRDCHGDLRPEHIYFSDQIRIIDCIEFNRRFRYSDITADMGFLCMELDFLGHHNTSSRLIRAYVERSGDWKLYSLLDFYRCYRALVRTKINCFRLAGKPDHHPEHPMLRMRIHRYLTLAHQAALRFSRPLIWVICGQPATGKSTIGSALAGAYGICHINSDVVRKILFDLSPDSRRKEAFEQGIYSRGASALTYGRILLLAQEELRKGRSVVLDATWRSRHWRREVRRLGEDLGVAVLFVVCSSRDDVIRERLAAREKYAGVSDAGLELAGIMAASFEPYTELPHEIVITVDTNQPLDRCLTAILAGTHSFLLNLEPLNSFSL